MMTQKRGCHRNCAFRIEAHPCSCRMSSVAVEETEVLRILRDFLEEGGHAECLRTLEKNTGAGPQGLPSELQFVRELVLNGQWEELVKFLQPLSGLGESEDFNRCSYVVVKQQYLENLAKGSNGGSETTGSRTDEAELKKRENLRLQGIMANLQRLEQLCPTKEDYSNLCYLLTLPSLAAHSNYCNWNVHSARLNCFYFIANWVAKVLYPHTIFKLAADSAKKGLSSNHMVQLLAKGLLYEECETVCAQRCGDSEARPEILDLCGWMQQQPDSAFQLSPSRLSLVVVPHPSQGQTATCSNELSESGKSPHRMLQLSKSMMENFKSLPHPAMHRVVHNQTLVSRSAPDLKVVDLTSETNTNSDSREGEGPANEEVEEKRSEKEMERVNEKEVAVQKSQQERTGGIPTQAAVDRKPHTQLMRQEVGATTKKKETKPRKSNTSKKTTVEVEHTDSHIASQAITANPVHDSASQQHNAIEIKHHTEPASCETQVPPTKEVSPRVQAQQREPQVPARPSAELEVYGKPKPPAIQTVEQFEDNFNPMPPTTPFQTTPLIHRSKGGRNSSTPKPSGYHLFPSHSSPSTSPVPYVPGTHGLIDSPSRFGKKSTRGLTECPLEQPVGRHPNKDGLSSSSEQSSARKHIDFGADSSQWPTATLISTITDPQVVRSVAFSQSGEVVAVGANSKTLRLCSSPPLARHRAGLDELPIFFHHPRYHRGSIYCLAWWGNSLLASGSNDQNIKLLSHSPSQCIPCGHLSVHNGTVRDLVFLPSGELVSGGAGNPALMISDCSAGKLIGSHEGHLDQILAVAIVDETTVASSSQDKTVRLWDTRQQRAFHTLVLTHPVTSLSTHHNHNHLATSHLDGSCSIHDMRTLKTLSSVQPHSNECRSVRYSPDGHWLLTGSYDGNICLVNVESLEWRRVAQHGDKVIQCRWHTAGQVIASTGADKKACFWALQY